MYFTKYREKTMRKSILKVVAAVMFAFLLSFNVTTSMNGTDDFSLEGFTELAVASSTSSCHDTNTCSCRDVEGSEGSQTCVDCSSCGISHNCDGNSMTSLCGKDDDVED